VSPVAIEGLVSLAVREGVVMSRDGHSHEGAEPSSGQGDPGFHDVECATVIGEAWTFLDGECTDETRARVCQHLEACSRCLRHFALEGRIKNLIATKCGTDKVPEWLRWHQ
jgi:mycothiol system anti-sigma-R factor